MSKLSKQAPTTVEMGNEESKKAEVKGVVVIKEEVEQSLDGEAVGEQVETGMESLELEQKNAGQEEKDERSIVMSGDTVNSTSSAATPTPITTNDDDEKALTTTDFASSSANDNTIDTRSPYRQGSPLLPALPLRTIHVQIPKSLSASSPHMFEFRRILKSHTVTVHNVEVAHRFNTGTPLSKSTLTLLISSNIFCKDKWEPAIATLRDYISTNSLTLAVEIIDTRILQGVFTLLILSTDPLTPFIAKKKHGILKLLNEYGAEWSSLEFWYRGLGKQRDECKPTVLVGVPEPNLAVWWKGEGGEKGIVQKIKEKVGARMEVEICFRVLGKVQ